MARVVVQWMVQSVVQSVVQGIVQSMVQSTVQRMVQRQGKARSTNEGQGGSVDAKGLGTVNSNAHTETGPAIG